MGGRLSTMMRTRFVSILALDTPAQLAQDKGTLAAWSEGAGRLCLGSRDDAIGDGQVGKMQDLVDQLSTSLVAVLSFRQEFLNILFRCGHISNALYGVCIGLGMWQFVFGLCEGGGGSLCPFDSVPFVCSVWFAGTPHGVSTDCKNLKSGRSTRGLARLRIRSGRASS